MKKQTLYDILNRSYNAVGVDIDDVIISVKEQFAYYSYQAFKDRLRKPFKNEDYTWMVLENVRAMADAGITREDVSTMLKKMESDGIIENVMPRHNCIQSLNILSRRSEIYFVTSRGDRYFNDAEGMTERWLAKVYDRYRFKPKDVIFNHNKEETLSKYGIGLFFEDNPIFSLNILKHGIPVVLFDTSWNRMCERDSILLTEKAYEKKCSVISEIEKYTNTLLFRVPDWSYIIKNLK